MKGMNFQPGLMTPEGIQSLVAYLNWLVVEPYPSKKYEFVSWDCSSQYMEQIKFMFQTTKQKVPSFCRDHEQWCCLPRNVGSARTQLIPIVEHRYSCWFEAKQFTTWGSTFYGRNHHLNHVFHVVFSGQFICTKVPLVIIVTLLVSNLSLDIVAINPTYTSFLKPLTLWFHQE